MTGDGHSAAADRESAARVGTERDRSWWRFPVVGGGVSLLIVAFTWILIRPTGEAARPRPPSDPPTELHLVIHERHASPGLRFASGLSTVGGDVLEALGGARSRLRRRTVDGGQLVRERSLDARVIPGDVTVVGDRLYMLSGEVGECHVWTLDSLDHRRTIFYSAEGHGGCWDGNHLVLADGPRLTFREPSELRVRRAVLVRESGEPVEALGALACAANAVYAVAREGGRVYRIEPETGRVSGVTDVSNVLGRRAGEAAQGLTFWAEREHFLMVGDRPEILFEVSFEESDGPVEDAE